MKITLATLVVLLALPLHAQSLALGGAQKAPVAPQFIVIYRTTDSVLVQAGDSGTLEERIVTHVEPFDTLADVLAFLGDERPHGNAWSMLRISPDDLIGVYRLSDASRVAVTLRKETREEKREVVTAAVTVRWWEPKP